MPKLATQDNNIPHKVMVIRGDMNIACGPKEASYWWHGDGHDSSEDSELLLAHVDIASLW